MIVKAILIATGRDNVCLLKLENGRIIQYSLARMKAEIGDDMYNEIYMNACQNCRQWVPIGMELAWVHTPSCASLVPI